MVFISLIISVFLSPWPGLAQNAELESRLSDCATVLKSIMATPDAGIPRDLIRRSRAVVLFPSVLKAGLGIGGHYGKGVALRRDPAENTWGPPVFVSIYGGSFGWQFGVQSIELVLLIMNDVSLKNLFRDKFALGADASIAAGPIGRDASAQTDLGLSAALLSYSKAKGIYLGVSLRGSFMESDWESNEQYYGSDLSIIDIFFHKAGKPSPAGEVLMRLLTKYSS
jgi:lipid-binding SYLF domain-containing protein